MLGRGGEGVVRFSLEGIGLDFRDSYLEGFGDVRIGVLISLECGWFVRGRFRR